MLKDLSKRKAGLAFKPDSPEAKLVVSLIMGEREKYESWDKAFMFDIVNNSRNSIDVDKMDYILRDSRQMNVPHATFNHHFLVKEMRVIESKICYPENYYMEIHKLFKSRYNLHYDCYNHKTIHAYDAMITDILLETHNKLYDFTEVIFDAEKYVYLDDTILYDVEMSESQELANARDLCKRIK